MDLPSYILDLLSGFCHRLPERSLVSDGSALFCARCSGIYAGAFAYAMSACLCMAFRVPAGKTIRPLLIILAALTPAEVLLERTGFSGGNSLRYWLATFTCVGILEMCCAAPHAGRGRLSPRIAARLLIAGIIGALIGPISRIGSACSSTVRRIVSVLGFFAFFGILVVSLLRTLVVYARCSARNLQLEV